MLKDFYELPVRVRFYDPFEDVYNYGIAYRDEIICACCGSIFEISEVLETASLHHKSPGKDLPWIDFSETFSE